MLTAFLVFAGFGSARCGRLSLRYGRRKVVAGVVGAIVLFCLSYLILLPPLFAWSGGLPMLPRFVLAIVLVAPMAFCMGMPMPLALDSLAEFRSSLIPWAWGINGCASVVSSVLATLLAMQFGFSLVIMTAMALYVVAAISFP